MERAFGIRPVKAILGLDLICVFESEKQVREMNPDQNALMQIEGRIQNATARGTTVDCVSRSFCPKISIAEDPVCGSAHVQIADYWLGELGKDAIDAIGKFGEDTVTGLKNILGIESPSKVTYGIGKYFDEGFANAVTDYAYLSEDAVAGMADGSIATMAGTLSSLSDMVMDEVDTDPVIKPVLDLSDVMYGTSLMDGMLNSDRSLQLTAGVSDGINANLAQQASMRSAFDDLRMSLGNIGKDDGKEPRQVNNFYISGDDPRAIADEVSRILQTKVERKGMTWA
jgi:hypothetical protein